MATGFVAVIGSYSNSALARRKKALDEKLVRDGTVSSIEIDDIVYWKSIIKAISGIEVKDRRKEAEDKHRRKREQLEVRDKALRDRSTKLKTAPPPPLPPFVPLPPLSPPPACPEWQFFIIKDGFEGFLQVQYSGPIPDADWVNPISRADPSWRSDVSDCLVVFNQKADALLGVFQLINPRSRYGHTSAVIRTWDNMKVTTYWNDHFLGPYRTFTVMDGYKSLPVGGGHYWVDIHHNQGTLGCLELSPVGPDGADIEALAPRQGGREFGVEPTLFTSLLSPFYDAYSGPITLGSIRRVGSVGSY